MYFFFRSRFVPVFVGQSIKKVYVPNINIYIFIVPILFPFSFPFRSRFVPVFVGPSIKKVYVPNINIYFLFVPIFVSFFFDQIYCSVIKCPFVPYTFCPSIRILSNIKYFLIPFPNSLFVGIFVLGFNILNQSLNTS